MTVPMSARLLPAAMFFLATSTASLGQDAAVVQIAIKDHRFQPAEARAPAGRPITLVVKNLDSTPEEFESKTLRVERVIPGNSESRIQLRPLQPGRYKFFGEFHDATAQGVLVVE